MTAALKRRLEDRDSVAEAKVRLDRLRGLLIAEVTLLELPEHLQQLLRATIQAEQEFKAALTRENAS